MTTREPGPATTADTHPTRSSARWEAALEVRCALIAQQLTDLALVEHQLPRSFWQATTFTSAADVAARVTREIRRISLAYRVERRRAGSDDHQALLAVIEAESAIDAIGRDPRVTGFLALGTGVELERFAMACRMLVALLDVSPAAAAGPSAPPRGGAGSGGPGWQVPRSPRRG